MWTRQKTKLLFLIQVSSLFISSPLSAGQIRLAGPASTRCSGRVEVHHNGTWGTVCTNDWDKNDANVVCRQLGCGKALGATGSPIFGEGTGEIWLDDVKCSGRESSLTTCKHGGFGTHNCGHGEGAGVVCSASLPKPSITMNPAGEVTWGHDVSITCTISAELLGGTFILEKTSGSFRKTQTPGSNPATFSIPKVSFDHYGSYRCQYEKTISGQKFSSPFSDDAPVIVTVSFPKPSISMKPAGKLTWGQKVGITCSISTQVLGGKFILTRTVSSFRKDKKASTNSASFWIHKADFADEGLYRCQYQTSGSRRYFRSPLSDLVRLSITVRLQRPNISLTSSNSGLVWGPEGAVVSRGSSFTFTCSISSSYTQGRFFLIFSGSIITDSRPAVNNSASFNFPVAEYDHQGNYSCVYELTLSTRRFNSTEAAPITVVIKLSLLLLIFSINSGILLLLLLVLMMLCWVRRIRRPSQPPMSLNQNQMAVSVQNSSIDNDDEDDDYENINFVDMMKKLGKQEEEEGSDDYEKPFTDDDHVYMEAGPDPNCLMDKEIWVAVEDYTEEDDEEEESSDEDDYVNVSPSCEQTEDMSQQHENVYQNF